VPKAKALYYFRGLDEQLFTSLPGASYPPLLPVLDAAAFHAMGAPDVVTLHVQFWFFALGFVAAVAGLLSGKVPAWILWPLLVLLLVVPRVSGRLTTPQADFLVDELIVVATVLVALWLQDGGRWRLALAVPLLGAAVLAKREGVLLAACLLASALLVCARRARATWPPLLALAAVVAAIGIPWRIWYVTHGIGGEAPPSGDGASLDRVWPSLRLALDVLFDDGRWSVIAPLAVAAVLLAALARAWAPALFFGVLLVLVTLGGGWITWSYTELPITSDESVNPIVRYTGAAVLLAGVATMLLLAAVWERLAPDREQA